MSALAALLSAPAPPTGHGGSKSTVIELIIGLVFIVIGGLQGFNPELELLAR